MRETKESNEKRVADLAHFDRVATKGAGALLFRAQGAGKAGYMMLWDGRTPSLVERFASCEAPAVSQANLRLFAPHSTWYE